MKLMDPQVPGYWTDEKHVDFLNTIEASFVRAMLGKVHIRRGSVLRLNRHLPDGFDSTVDLKPQPKSTKLAAAASPRGVMGPRNRSITRRADRRRRRVSSKPYDSSVDQVVPQMEGKMGVDDESSSS